MLWEQRITGMYHPFRDNIGETEMVYASMLIVLCKLIAPEYASALGYLATGFFAYKYIQTSDHLA
jgi:hypothetical protein